MERLTDTRWAFPPDAWIEATRETRKAEAPRIKEEERERER